MPREELADEALHEIRRAAFELREQDPQEAVRLLRRLAGQGGGAEVLARGALAEIYLEEFGDLDGAEHEFRAVLKSAPGLAAAELGLGRVLREQGRTREADAAFVRAISALEQDVRGFQQALAPGSEEVVLTLLDVAVELADLRRGANAGSAAAVPLDESLLSWAADKRLFDSLRLDDEAHAPGADDQEDWVRFHQLWTELRLKTGRALEAAQALAAAEERGQLVAAAAARLRSLALEEQGDLASAHAQALRMLDEELRQGHLLRPEDVLRAAALGDKEPAVRPALVQLEARLLALGAAPEGGLAREAYEEDKAALLETLHRYREELGLASTAPGTLVPLGRKKS